MAGSDRSEVELRKTPCLYPCGPDKDPKRPQGQGYPGEDQLPPRPLREKYRCRPGRGCVGGGQGQGGPRQATLRRGGGFPGVQLSQHIAAG